MVSVLGRFQYLKLLDASHQLLHSYAHLAVVGGHWSISTPGGAFDSPTWYATRDICMGLVMQELDYCLSSGQEQGLNEELGRYRGREGKSECVWCGVECECSSCIVGVFSL